MHVACPSDRPEPALQGAADRVAALASALQSVRPLIDVLERPVPLQIDTADIVQAQAVIDGVARRLAVPAIRLTQPSAERTLDVFARAVSTRLAEAVSDWPAALGDLDEIALDAAAEAGLRRAFEGRYPVRIVSAPDGVPLRAYAAGPSGAPAIVLTLPCGMPAKLAATWIERLAVTHRVLTWESRGLFGADALHDGAADVQAQAGDLLAVMEAFHADDAHVAGLCGGAVVALAAASEQPRIRSLSLWHGDYNLGPGGPTTAHQINLKAILDMAASCRGDAADLYPVLCRSLEDRPPPTLPHLVLYPYATLELFYRYARLNGAIMGFPVSSLLGRVEQRALVVTSRDDVTAHPQASDRVADSLRRGTLRVLPHGDHLSLFTAAGPAVDVLRAFLTDDG